MKYCTSPLGAVGGSQFSSIPATSLLVMDSILGGDGPVHQEIVMYTMKHRYCWVTNKVLQTNLRCDKLYSTLLQFYVCMNYPSALVLARNILAKISS